MDQKILTLVLLCMVLAPLAGAAKFSVAECEDDVDLDGDGDDDAWEDAESDDFGDVVYFGCYDEDNLYFLVTVEDNTTEDDDLVQIWIDPDASGGDEVENDDFGFEINRDGDLTEYQGDDDEDVEGWDADNQDDDETWNAEFEISLSKLGIKPGDDTVMGFMIFASDTNGTDSRGPGSADEDEPDSWATLKPDEGSWGKKVVPTLTSGTAKAVGGTDAGAPGDYVFEVVYKQSNGAAPDEVRVMINGQANRLTKESSSCNIASGCKYSVKKSLDEGTYIFYFNAAYSSGSIRYPQDDLSLRISRENKKPTVSISSPDDGDQLTGSFTFLGTAADPDGNSDLASVEAKIDSSGWIRVSGTNRWEYAYDTKNLADGTHSISVRATDQDGLMSDIESVSFSVENVQKPPPGKVDSDSDGMTDVWELANGLDPDDATDAGRDPDNDGATNLQEFIAGTNPKKSDKEEPVKPESKGLFGDEFMIIILLTGIIVAALIVMAYQMGKGKGRQQEPKRLVPRPVARPVAPPSEQSGADQAGLV